ncbi:hypothetical protein [Sulfuricystis multivorans]|uniref:hypothetical protein n=1 Tax=Sulfuricystis multivorans TaxID=2211108 RepID=UPI000F83B379|nr:hypothetical protein [Sulfuricystis multivorans]
MFPKLNLLLLISLLSVPAASFAGWFGPSNYDECILESMKGVTSDVAARMVARSCREKFPDKPKAQPRSRELNSSELDQITGRAGISFGDYFGGTLYNGNGGITISQITVVATTKEGKKDVSRTYVTDVSIPPQTTADFHFIIVKGDEGSDYSWGIVAGRGY